MVSIPTRPLQRYGSSNWQLGHMRRRVVSQLRTFHLIWTSLVLYPNSKLFFFFLSFCSWFHVKGITFYIIKVNENITSRSVPKRSKVTNSNILFRKWHVDALAKRKKSSEKEMKEWNDQDTFSPNLCVLKVLNCHLARIRWWILSWNIEGSLFFLEIIFQIPAVNLIVPDFTYSFSTNTYIFSHSTPSDSFTGQQVRSWCRCDWGGASSPAGFIQWDHPRAGPVCRQAVCPGLWDHAQSSGWECRCEGHRASL